MNKFDCLTLRVTIYFSNVKFVTNFENDKFENDFSVFVLIRKRINFTNLRMAGRKVYTEEDPNSCLK